MNMKKQVLLYTLSFFLNYAAYSQQTSSDGSSNPVKQVTDAEKSFAKLAYDKSMQEAFVAYMNDSSIIERQGKLINGLEIYRQMKPDTAGKLIWAPAFATVSAAGDMGYTTGPYHYNLKGENVAFGDFATVWQKQDNGQWKFVIDLGCSHSQPGDVPIVENYLLPEKHTRTANASNSLLVADSQFNAAISTNRPATQLVHPQVHIIQDGKQLQVGPRVVELLSGDIKRNQIQQAGYKLAKSKDLGVVYGYCSVSETGNKEKKGVYMHVWRLGSKGQWQLLHETLKLAK
jgi:ketosteroid isomerase-like protein